MASHNKQKDVSKPATCGNTLATPAPCCPQDTALPQGMQDAGLLASQQVDEPTMSRHPWDTKMPVHQVHDTHGLMTHECQHANGTPGCLQALKMLVHRVHNTHGLMTCKHQHANGMLCHCKHTRCQPHEQSMLRGWWDPMTAIMCKFNTSIRHHSKALTWNRGQSSDCGHQNELPMQIQ